MITENKQKVLSLFAEGRELYKNRDFKSAMGKFEQALALDSEDGPSKVYYSRCKHYVESPPPDDWDGVFVMKTK
jgi:hypothetical protein